MAFFPGECPRFANRLGGSRGLGAGLAVAAMLAGCADRPGDELEARECLFVYSAASRENIFEAREVPVCGSIIVEPDGVTRLKDFVRPTRFVRLEFPADARRDPSMAQALAAADALRKGEKIYFEARFHGRIEVRRHLDNVLHVTRVDWIGGEPGTRP